eukprot:1920965-Amphidinium_carterae.1
MLQNPRFGCIFLKVAKNGHFYAFSFVIGLDSKSYRACTVRGHNAVMLAYNNFCQTQQIIGK